MRDPSDPAKVVAATSAVLGESPSGQKRWTESGEANPETTDTYCWKVVKAGLIKTLKDKNYGFGEMVENSCRVLTDDSCYHVTMECRKERDEKSWSCNPKLQELNQKNVKCEKSPTATACDCKPDRYWKCGAGAMKGGAKPKKQKP